MGKVQKLVVDGTVDTCPVCGYTDGWHVSFKVEDSVKMIILICPDCHSRFNSDWNLS